MFTFSWAVKKTLLNIAVKEKPTHKTKERVPREIPRMPAVSQYFSIQGKCEVYCLVPSVYQFGESYKLYAQRFLCYTSLSKFSEFPYRRIHASTPTQFYLFNRETFSVYLEAV